MKKTFFIILIFLSVLSGCRKDKTPRTSGTDTIDNTVFQTTTYYAFGFSFSKAKLVSTINNQGYDIVVYVNIDNLVHRLTLQANNLKPSFYKVGDFTDEGAAKSAFNNLKTISVPQWEDMADPIKDNQVWVYRTDSECYAKIRIISSVLDNLLTPVYGKCTFEWIYQPDGSLTFPGK